MKITFAPNYACKNNRWIWRHNAWTSHSCDFNPSTDQLEWSQSWKSLPHWLTRDMVTYALSFISYTLSREYRVVRNRYTRLLFTNGDLLRANLHVQEQSTNMASQCQLAYVTDQPWWCHNAKTGNTVPGTMAKGAIDACFYNHTVFRLPNTFVVPSAEYGYIPLT